MYLKLASGETENENSRDNARRMHFADYRYAKPYVLRGHYLFKEKNVPNLTFLRAITKFKHKFETSQKPL